MSYEVVRLRDVADIVTGSTPSKSNDEFWTNGIIPFVTPGELKYNSTNYVESAFDNVTELALSTARAVPKNSVMVCCIGSLGKLGIASRDLITNQQINSVVFKEEVAYYKFGYYAISLLRNEMEKIAPSTTVKIINKTLFSNLKIPLPPLDIQKKIADTLDKAQELIDKRKEQISALDKFLENLFLDMFGDPVSNPIGWEEKSLEALSHKITDGKHGDCVNDENSNYYFISAKDLINGKIDYSNARTILKKDFEEVHRRTDLEWNDVLIVSTGASIGKTALAKSQELVAFTTFQKSVAIIKNKRELLSSHYLKNYLDFNTKFIHSVSTGSGQKNLLLKDIRALMIPLPPLDLQNQFASIVEKVEAEKTKLEASLTEMEDNFNSIMQRAFKGELF